MAYRRTEQVEARLARTRRTLVATALDLVAAGGWSALTVAAVARGASVATGTVYRHVASKDALAVEVFRVAAGRELAHVTDVAARPDPPLVRLDAALRAFARRSLRAPRLAYALLAEPAGPAVEAERLVHREGYRRVFRGLLDDAVTGGALAPHDTTVTAAVLVGAVGEALVGPLAALAPGGDGAPPQDRVDELVVTCLRALPPA